MCSDPEFHAGRGLSARALLRGLLLVQALAALGLAWLFGRRGMGPWAALAAGCACVVAVRLAINMNNFVLAAWATPGVAPPGRRLGAGARLRLLAGEFCASMLVTSWHMPRARARLAVYPDSPLPPVLLLHGYGCNSGYWARLTPLLDAARISHATLDLEPAGAALDDYVPQVEARVRALCAACATETAETAETAGAVQVVLVAHSMGGLVARAWMRAHGDARVARLVTLGTPHHGTALARFGLGANARQMRPGSAWLAALAGAETPARRAAIVSLYTRHDNIVAPPASSELDGARNVGFDGIGHVALGSDARVLAAVMAELASLAAVRR